MANWILLDGNTYEDSRSIEDYDNEYVSLTFGFAYSWKDTAISFAINDLNALSGIEEDLSEYGTLTYAWRSY